MSGAKQRTTTPRRLKSYPAYKDSGIEWLGKIPAHWEVKRLKSIASVELSNVDKKSVEGQESIRLCNYTDVYYNERITPDLEFMAATATQEQVCRFALRAGDVLITKDSESWTDIAVPAVVAADLPDVLCGYHLAHVRLGGGCVGAFLSRAFSAIGPRDQFQVAANGITRFGLGGDAIRTGLFAIPPEREQRAIAAFLDRETARIDALVAKKERLIELLQEKRAALITRAVTKGLDSTVPMRDSGVEWLGEIPAHWEVKPMKHVADFINGFAFKPDEWIAEGTPIIRIENLNGGDSFNFTDRALPAKYWAEKGDLLFGWSGNRGTSFGPFLWWRAGRHYVNQHIFRVVDFACDKLWLYWMLRAVTFYVEKQAHGIIGMVHITRGELGSIPVPQLPRPEQEKIAAYLNLQHERLDALTDRVRDAIDRLKELRTALISAAVTGKIDVRQEVA